MSAINYSKWDHIEISDDEDDTHPNIDTGSLFRWRHQARLERMEQSKKEKDELERGKKDSQQKLEEIKKKLQESEQSAEVTSAELESLKLEMTETEKQEKEFKKKEEELMKKEKLTPLNIDTICHDATEKTLINKSDPAPKKALTDDERTVQQQTFIKKNKAKVKKFGMMKKYEDSQQYLVDNTELVCEEAANYLVIWCIDLEMEEKHDLMNHVAHQTIVMQFILELAKQLDIDPRGCVRSFFSRIKLAEKQYMEAFNDELNGFKDRICQRAKVKLEEAMKEYEEEERQKRLGPGGLDPMEVFESLPEKMKECFDKKDLGLLQKIIVELPKEEAEYHMKRCVDSGLWVPNAEDLQKSEAGATGDASSGDPVYDKLDPILEENKSCDRK